MNMPDKQNKGASDDPSATQPGSVYNRLTSELRRHTPPPRISSPTPPRSKRSSLGHEILLTNIRTFVLVALCMFFLLGISVQITRKAWQTKQQRARQATAPLERDREAGIVMDTEDPSPRGEFDSDAVRRALSETQQADAMAAAGQHREAIDRYRRALEIWPHLTAAWASLGRVHLETGEYPRAQAALERAAEAEPGNAQILNDLGVAHLYQNRFTQAMQFFETATTIDPRFAPSRFNIALCHIAKKEYEEAEHMLDQYLQLEPEDPNALKEKAFLQAYRGEHEHALQTLREAIHLAPDWPALYFDAAAAAALLGSADDTFHYLEKAEALTTPSKTYRAYQQAAFREVRVTQEGQRFEKRLEARAQERPVPGEAKTIPSPGESKPVFSHLPDP